MTFPGYMPGPVEYVEGMSQPTLQVNIAKLDNGYVVRLQELKKRRPVSGIQRSSNPFAGLSADEIIDKLVDGMGGFLRTINDAGAGEDWKGSENRAQMREAFKMLFPGMAQNAEQLANPTDPEVEEETRQPRQETLVFESKESLMRYLGENLKDAVA